METDQFYGNFPAVVTPFSSDGQNLDFDSLSNVIEYVLEGGARGVVMAGSTGEAATLTDGEYRILLQRTQEIVRGRCLLIAGVGANSTKRAIEIAQTIRELRYDAALVVTPPYNKPSQAGLEAHFASISQAVGFPLIAYNVPGRTGVNILPETLARLWKQGAIAAVKEASGSVEQGQQLLALTAGGLPVLSGEDALVHPLLACGAKGVISATANIIPELFSEMVRAGLNGDWKASRELQWKVLPMVKAMFVETNPVPVKMALAMKGVIASSMVRLPLLPAVAQTRDEIECAMQTLLSSH